MLCVPYLFLCASICATRFAAANKKCIKNVWEGAGKHFPLFAFGRGRQTGRGRGVSFGLTAFFFGGLSKDTLKRQRGGDEGATWHTSCICMAGGIVVVVVAALSQWKICHANSQMSNIQLLCHFIHIIRCCSYCANSLCLCLSLSLSLSFCFYSYARKRQLTAMLVCLFACLTRRQLCTHTHTATAAASPSLCEALGKWRLQPPWRLSASFAALALLSLPKKIF